MHNAVDLAQYVKQKDLQQNIKVTMTPLVEVGMPICQTAEQAHAQQAVKQNAINEIALLMRKYNLWSIEGKLGLVNAE